MIGRCLLGAVVALVLTAAAQAQEVVRMKSAVVALTDEAELRAGFERSLVQMARANDYDAVTTYDLVPNVNRIDDERFVDRMLEEGVQFVLLLRPAAIGEGSSLESVRNEVPPELFENMEHFAAEVSPAGGDDLIAVVHLAIYSLIDGQPELIAPGVVWLDEEVENQAQGIERLQNLILYNVNAVRPAIRRHLGLAPLP